MKISRYHNTSRPSAEGGNLADILFAFGIPRNVRGHAYPDSRRHRTICRAEPPRQEEPVCARTEYRGDAGGRCRAGGQFRLWSCRWLESHPPAAKRRDAPVLEVGVLLFSLAGNPEHQALIEECWRARDGGRRHTVPPKIKRELCRLAVAHVVELRRQMILHQCILANEKNLRRQGYSDPQIDEIMTLRVRECPMSTHLILKRS